MKVKILITKNRDVMAIIQRKRLLLRQGLTG